ncbi:MAG: DUF2267 domain-containing protein [Planctomycetes bacterium]|nr:DUF2267 domain-containing protein [Planctomycetota bacterium]
MTGFEPAADLAQAWLLDLERELGSASPRLARQALRATLHALRDYLTVDEAARLGGQLPLLWRGLFYENWTPSAAPKRLLGVGPFLQAVREHHGGPLDSRRVVRGVFKVLCAHAGRGEIEPLDRVLPAPLLKLWPRDRAACPEHEHEEREPTVARVMTRGVYYSGPECSLKDVLERMDEARVRHLLVVLRPELAEGGAAVPRHAILGMLSNRDLLRHLRARPAGNVRLDRLRVSDLMTPAPLISVGPDSSLSAAAEVMRRHRVSALPVLDERELLGLVTSEDLLEAAYPPPQPAQRAADVA